MVDDSARVADDAALLAVIVGRSPVGVALFDTHARYVRVNPALQRLVGLDAAEMLGHTVREIVPGPTGAFAHDRLREVLATGRPVVGADLEGRLPSSQRSLLPERLPPVPGVVAAARYLPARSGGGEVGGDRPAAEAARR